MAEQKLHTMDPFAAVKAILDNTARWHEQEIAQKNEQIRRLRAGLVEITQFSGALGTYATIDHFSVALKYALKIAWNALEETDEH